MSLFGPSVNSRAAVQLDTPDEVIGAMSGDGVFMFALEGCPHCVAMKPVFQSVASQHANVPSYIVYADVITKTIDAIPNKDDTIRRQLVTVSEGGFPYVARLRGGQLLRPAVEGMDPNTKQATKDLEALFV